MELSADTPVKQIVILGGSYAGISTAHYLLKHVIPLLPPRTHRVMLVNPSTETMCRPACPRALISDSMFPQDKLFANIPTQFQQYPTVNFTFVHAKAIELKHADREVTLELNGDSSRQIVKYHTLVIATGSSTISPLLGYTKDSVYLRKKWQEFRSALPQARSIVIAGGGPAGIETAGELGEYLNGRGLSKKRESAKVAITVVTSGMEILPVLRPSIASGAEQLLADVGVRVIKGTKVVSVSPSSAGTEEVATNATISLHDGTTLEADLYIPAVGVSYNTNFIDKSLLDSSGRVAADSTTLRVVTGGDSMFAVGDVCSAARPAIHNVFAQIPIVCENIKRDLLDIGDSGSDRLFSEDKRESQLVPIGRSKAVGAIMGWSLPGILVWLIKGRDYWLWTTSRLWSGSMWSKAS